MKSTQLSSSSLQWYYHHTLSHYHGITMTFVSVTVTNVVKYIVLSPLPWYYHCLHEQWSSLLHTVLFCATELELGRDILFVLHTRLVGL